MSDSSYETYEDNSDIERRFLENKDEILKLKPKDIKAFGISRQTLSNVKKKMVNNHIERILVKIKTRSDS